MTILLETEWQFIDGSNKEPKWVNVGPGEFEIERVPNPYGLNNNWLVLKGTKTGLSERYLRDFWAGLILNCPGHQNHGMPIGNYKVTIKE